MAKALLAQTLLKVIVHETLYAGRNSPTNTTRRRHLSRDKRRRNAQSLRPDHSCTWSTCYNQPQARKPPILLYEQMSNTARLQWTDD